MTSNTTDASYLSTRVQAIQPSPTLAIATLIVDEGNVTTFLFARRPFRMWVNKSAIGD